MILRSYFIKFLFQQENKRVRDGGSAAGGSGGVGGGCGFDRGDSRGYRY